MALLKSAFMELSVFRMSKRLVLLNLVSFVEFS